MRDPGARARVPAGYVGSGVAGALAYVVGLVVSMVVLSGIDARFGEAGLAAWANLMFVVPGLVAGLVGVLALRLTSRPPGYAGVVASLGGALVAVVLGAGALILTASRGLGISPWVVLVLPVFVTVVTGLGAGLLRARAWTAPEVQLGYVSEAGRGA